MKMRNVDSHLLEVKMDEAVTHYINTHQTDEVVHVDANSLALNVQDDSGRVTVMHTQNYIPMCRTVGEHDTEGQWGEELLDPEGRLAALMAHITAQNSRGTMQQSFHKEITVRTDVDSSVILDSSMRLFNGHTLDPGSEPIVVEVPHFPSLSGIQSIKRCSETDWFDKSKTVLKDHSTDTIVIAPHLPPLPRLQGMKRCQENDWMNNKQKSSLKVISNDNTIVTETDGTVLELEPGASPVHSRQQSKKSLPHKKRISRKLNRTKGNSTPQQDILVINCAEDGHQEEILPDSFVTAVPHQEHLSDDPHISDELRPVLLCQLCGEFFGEDQLKFFHHLKEHYEPHGTIIIENPVSDLAIDKMTNSCIVDNVSALPDSIMELSLENTVPKTMYQSIDKHILYTTSDKAPSYINNKVQYTMAGPYIKESSVVSDPEKHLYESLDKLDLYSCNKCNKTFRKQKQCEAHMKEAHSNPKLEDMAEFSEPEDLMEGIHVSVEDGGDHYEQNLLPHLTVENGHVHQEHVRQWYLRQGGAACEAEGAGYCPVCPAPPVAPAVEPHPAQSAQTAQHPVQHPVQHPEQHPAEPHQLKVLKEEVYQHILESDVATDTANFPDTMMPEPAEIQPEPLPTNKPQKPTTDTADINVANGDKKKPQKRFDCTQCNRVFQHRNSLLYHLLSHSSKQQVCRECGKGFYTSNALKIHKRVHNGDKPCKCDICGRDFRQWSDLKYHKMSIHSTQKTFKCEFCGKEFARKYSLNVHRRIHTGERNYKCEYCNKSFRASSYRLSHMRTHTGDKPYKCAQCEKCFRAAGDLRRHMITHDKLRNRLDAHNKTTKQQKEAKKPPAKAEEDNQKTESTSRILRKILVSTTKTPVKSPSKKTSSKKKPPSKKGAPNVTIDQMDSEYTDNVEVFDTRQNDEYKFKDTYEGDYKEVLDFGRHIIGYKTDHSDREISMVRPIYRNSVCDSEVKPIFKSENTDGKMQIYTHIVKGGNQAVSNSQVSDMRQFERDVRGHMQGENIENGFIERLTELYNIQTV